MRLSGRLEPRPERLPKRIKIMCVAARRQRSVVAVENSDPALSRGRKRIDAGASEEPRQSPQHLCCRGLCMD